VNPYKLHQDCMNSLDGSPTVVAVMTSVTTNSNLPSRTGCPTPATDGGAEVRGPARAVVVPGVEARVVVLPLSSLSPEFADTTTMKPTTAPSTHGHRLGRFLTETNGGFRMRRLEAAAPRIASSGRRPSTFAPRLRLDPGTSRAEVWVLVKLS
jgi:hypothetical protein